MARERKGSLYLPDATGAFVLTEPVSRSRVASASVGQLVAKAADGTLELIDAPEGGGGGGGGGSLVYIGEVSGSNVAALDLVAGFSDDYDRYVLEGLGIIPSTDNQDLKLRVSTNGGSSFDSGGSDYGYHWMRGRGGSTTDNDNAWADNTEAWAHIASNIGNASGEGAEFRIYLENFRNTGMYKLWWAETTNISDTGEVARQLAVGTRYTLTALDAIRIYFFSGNISGTLRLYGVRKTSAPGGTTSPLTPDTVPESPAAQDDEFDTGSAIDTGLWTAHNATNLTDSVRRGALLLSIAGANASVNQRGYYQALPAGAAWEFETKVTLLGDVDSTTFEAGLWLIESATGKILSLHVGYSAGVLIWTSRWTNVTTFGATINTVTPVVTPVQNPYYLRIELSGSNYLCKYSKTGHLWTTLSTVAKTTPFTTEADRIGLKLYNDGAWNADGYGMFEHFRRVA
jgi:hypothetical protein